jgi:hypothetical protein
VARFDEFRGLAFIDLEEFRCVIVSWKDARSLAGQY